jgi:hypothetical protein
MHPCNFPKCNKDLILGHKLLPKHKPPRPRIYITKTKAPINPTKVKHLILIVGIKNLKEYLMQDSTHIKFPGYSMIGYRNCILVGEIVAFE